MFRALGSRSDPRQRNIEPAEAKRNKGRVRQGAALPRPHSSSNVVFTPIALIVLKNRFAHQVDGTE
jgi:hypothetical protein